ncbi:YutD family protein [Alkalicoccus luteus]|uniref:YutD family protein n=1 Tax=Alkalicoccus luteus TaxID=1237094 RepID=A0A969PTV0_9BACI|nr:YutD family protein [Alkalicoccus luteus]NJP38281.1 YutD family protein [Alkalicoccus luteus]
MITISGNTYEIVEDVRDGWDEEAFKNRYSDILNKYDYIVGDWGYEQLRLKGFFEEQHRKSSPDTKISFLQEYIYEYCNFGCAYFVLRKTKAKEKGSSESKQEAEQV